MTPLARRHYTVNGGQHVISHAAAALFIQPPMFATPVAVQITVWTRCLNGAKGEIVFDVLTGRGATLP